MICLDCDDFATWRQQARQLLAHGIDPADVSWEGADDLFFGGEGLPEGAGPFMLRVPRALLELLKQAACFIGPQRWSLLYEVLWRVAHGDRTAMLAGDSLGSELHRRIKQVRREIHHVHAFLRFTQRGELFTAWHVPAHDVLAEVGEHFVGRMGQQRWLIATPTDGLAFDGQSLDYRRECPAEWRALAHGEADAGQALWLAYYQHIFNPARLNPKAMQGHMPGRFWQHLPEGPLIPQLMSQARLGKQRDGQAEGVAARKGKAILTARVAPTTPGHG